MNCHSMEPIYRISVTTLIPFVLASSLLPFVLVLFVVPLIWLLSTSRLSK
jgi:hypothetical protein